MRLRPHEIGEDIPIRLTRCRENSEYASLRVANRKYIITLHKSLKNMAELYSKFIAGIIGMSLWIKIPIVLLLAAAFVVAIAMLRKEKPSSIFAIIALALGVYLIFLLFNMPNMDGPDFPHVWLVKTLSLILLFGPMMLILNSLWCIQRLADHDNFLGLENEETIYKIAKFLNNVIHIILLIFFGWWEFSMLVHGGFECKFFESNLFNMLSSLGICAAVGCLMCVLMPTLCRLLLESVNNGPFKYFALEYLIAGFVLMWKFTYAMVDGLLWIISAGLLLAWFVIIAGYCFKNCITYRCKRCHFLKARHENTIDRGTRQFDDKRWYDEGRVDISEKKWKDARVSNVQTEYNVKVTQRNYLNVYVCPRCGHKWEEFHVSEFVKEGKATGAKKWTENY